MGKSREKIDLSICEESAEAIIKHATPKMQKKLRCVNDACMDIIKQGGAVRVNSVRTWLAENGGIKIALSTLMNKNIDRRTGEKTFSLMRQIINIYIGMSISNSRSPDTSIGLERNHDKAVHLSSDELKQIHDHQLRYKISLMNREMRNLEAQVRILLSTSLPSLDHPQSSESKVSNVLVDGNEQVLAEEERDALQDLLDETSLRRRGIVYGDHGQLRVTLPPSARSRDLTLSLPYLRNAIAKVLARGDKSAG